jgi:hypothetical protein
MVAVFLTTLKRPLMPEVQQAINWRQVCRGEAIMVGQENEMVPLQPVVTQDFNRRLAAIAQGAVDMGRPFVPIGVIFIGILIKLNETAQVIDLFHFALQIMNFLVSMKNE